MSDIKNNNIYGAPINTNSNTLPEVIVNSDTPTTKFKDFHGNTITVYAAVKNSEEYKKLELESLKQQFNIPSEIQADNIYLKLLADEMASGTENTNILQDYQKAKLEEALLNEKLQQDAAALGLSVEDYKREYGDVIATDSSYQNILQQRIQQKSQEKQNADQQKVNTQLHDIYSNTKHNMISWDPRLYRFDTFLLNTGDGGATIQIPFASDTAASAFYDMTYSIEKVLFKKYRKNQKLIKEHKN